MSEKTTDFDIVMYGASSFVGRLVAAYLVEKHSDLRLALGGRNEQRLRDLGFELPIVLADAQDGEALDRMAESTKVIISTVGPYTRYGARLVEACATHGTHYVDLCGEALFVRRSIDQWHATAQRTGARIVHSCGFDSVPSDMGMFHLYEKAGDEPFSEVVMTVDKLAGGLSGGTIDSMREVSADAKKMPNGGAILHSPYSLSPDYRKEPDLGPQPDAEATYNALLGEWTGPFFMGMYNTRVVRRSNSLLNHAYGTFFRYSEVMPTGTGLAGKVKAKALLALTGLGFAAIMAKPLRKPLSVIVPEPGDGPKDINKGGFVITHHGKTESGTLVTSRVSANGDPGYKVTAMMLSEAAVVLATETAGLPERAGVLTPATALGNPYLHALQENGMPFS